MQTRATSNLDDPKTITALDPQGMLRIIEGAPKFIEWCLNEHELDAVKNVEKQLKRFVPKHVAGIFIAGMGGSAISGDILRDWIVDQVRVPVLVTRDYHLPACIGKSWLGFILSYSGNTEETLSTYVDAKQRGIKCICVTAGGLVEAAARKVGDVCLKVPGGLQPRAAMLYLFTTLAIAVAGCKLPGLDKQAMIRDLQESRGVLSELGKTLNSNVPASTNIAKQHAMAIQGTTVLIYGFDFYQSAARRFKGQINENGKNPAYYDVFSELNHNETVGWEVSNDVAKNFSCFFIRDAAQESAAISVRIDFTRKIIATKAKTTIEIVPSGKSRLARMLSIMYMADFISVYLAFVNGADPTPVKFIQGLKDELGKKVNVQAGIEASIAKLGKK